MIKKLVIVTAVFLLSACAGPQVTRVQALSKTADAPYQSVLVIALFELFDTRRYLEDAIVKELSDRGITAVASTSLMNTKTPVTRQTFLAMVEEHNSDAVVISQLVSLDSTVKENDSRPEATRIIRPTYYYNVWSVELTEFVEPPFLTAEHEIKLATQMYSVSAEEAVWAIESKSKIKTQRETQGDVSFITEEAKAIVRHLSRDGLLAQ
jgi:hypothetical protein